MRGHSHSFHMNGNGNMGGMQGHMGGPQGMGNMFGMMMPGMMGGMPGMSDMPFNGMMMPGMMAAMGMQMDMEPVMHQMGQMNLDPSMMSSGMPGPAGPGGPRGRGSIGGGGGSAQHGATLDGMTARSEMQDATLGTSADVVSATPGAAAQPEALPQQMAAVS